MPRASAVQSSRVAWLPFALAVLFAQAAGAADLYRWTDANGVIHYSDTQPRGQSKATRVRITGAESTDSSAQTPPAGSATTDPSQSTAAAPTAAADTQENRKQACDKARSTLELLQGKSPLADAASGKPLDAKARAERMVAVQQNVAIYCRNSQ
ncbi:DUF4124 domain-containing protein [Rudaea sp.]|uniref:DUF4124 domain-containing protein n=1 Tax=Rudaea sp. TaxID=2136325 RepID=UPI002ED11342